MILKHNETEMKLNRDESVFNTILEKVNELTQEDDVVFSHLMIDGVDIYEDHENYFNQNFDDIKEIYIVTKSMRKMIWETLQSVNEYLERAVPALQELVDESYEAFSPETWDGVSQLAEGIQWILQFKEFTQNASRQPKNWDEFAKNFDQCVEQFSPLLEAIEAQDTILISDILAYEITPIYEQLLENTKTMLLDTNFLNDVN